MSYKRLIPCIFIAGQRAVKWFNNKDLTKFYDERFENNDAVIKKILNTYK